MAALNALGQKENALAVLFSPASALPPLCNPIKNEQLYTLRTHAHANYSIS